MKPLPDVQLANIYQQDFFFGKTKKCFQETVPSETVFWLCGATAKQSILSNGRQVCTQFMSGWFLFDFSKSELLTLIYIPAH